MSFLYDRDYNVTGTVQTTFDFKPSYGTSVNFSADLSSYTTVDNYLYVMPKGLNHLQMTVQMPFENRKEAEATKIASFFENLRGTGYFTFTDPASIYKPINLFCGGIQTNFTVNDLYTIQVDLATDQVSPLLNWNGMFITGSNIKGEWATSTAYSKYDVVKYTGSALYPSTGNLYDCFYYCTGDHTSQSVPDGFDVLNGDWTQEFFYQPTYSSAVGKETSVLKTELPYSFTKRSDFGLHGNVIKQFQIEFKGISDAEARSILHFLISRQGYRKFQYKIPNIYNKNKYFFAPEWKHTFVYKNVNDISVTLVEDPVGIRKIYSSEKISYQIAAGYIHSLAIDKNNNAFGWGDNSGFQIGNPSTFVYYTPINVLGSSKVFRQISAGNYFSCALDKYGRAWGWGENYRGQLGDGSTIARCTPVSVVGQAKTFCKISAGTTLINGFCLAIDKYGRAWAWGDNSAGVLGNNSTTSRLTPVSVLGTVKTFCQISGAYVYSLAIDKYGRAWGWGRNSSGVLGDGSITSRLTPVSVAGAAKTFCKISGAAYGGRHSLAIDKYGRAWSWGFNLSGQLGDGSITSRLTPVSVAGAAKTFCNISCGNNHSLAIDKYGRAWGWGYNSTGQLGDGTITSRLTPVSVAGTIKTFCNITAGCFHNLAVDKYGRVWSWGQNNSGQLGDGSTTSRLTPVRVCNI